MSRELGRGGEEQTASFLRQRGWRIQAAGWQCRFGELDLVAENGEFLAFVEVKLRKNANFAQAREFVTPSKQRKLRAAAELYLMKYPTRMQPRFDVAEVYASQGVDTLNPVIRIWENAF